MPQKKVPTNHSEIWKQGYNTFLKAFEQAKKDNPNATLKQNVETARASAQETFNKNYPSPTGQISEGGTSKGAITILPDANSDPAAVKTWLNKRQEFGGGVGTAANDAQKQGIKKTPNQQHNGGPKGIKPTM